MKKLYDATKQYEAIQSNYKARSFVMQQIQVKIYTLFEKPFKVSKIYCFLSVKFLTKIINW